MYAIKIEWLRLIRSFVLKLANFFENHMTIKGLKFKSMYLFDEGNLICIVDKDTMYIYHIFLKFKNPGSLKTFHLIPLPKKICGGNLKVKSGLINGQ